MDDEILTLGMLAIGAYAVISILPQLQKTLSGVSTGVQGTGTGVATAATGAGTGISSAFTGAGTAISNTATGASTFVTAPASVFQNLATLANDWIHTLEPKTVGSYGVSGTW